MKTVESVDESATGFIIITKLPEGDPPLWVRKEWIGLTLPCHPYCGYPDGGLDRGVLSGEKASRNRRGFSVPQDRAIAILECERPLAAAWWKEKGYPNFNECFCFGEDEAEIVDGVLLQSLQEITDEMQGQSGR